MNCLFQHSIVGKKLYHSLSCYRCRCPIGYSGIRCEVDNSVVKPDDVCSPNPCKGDCRCELSCKHEDGYMCISPSGLLGKNCDIRKLFCCSANLVLQQILTQILFLTAAPIITCAFNQITVDISKAFFDAYNTDSTNSYFYVSPYDTFKKLFQCQGINLCICPYTVNH